MIYYVKCTCTTQQRLKVKTLRKEGHEVRIVNNPTWRQESKLYGVKLPFVVIDEDKKIGHSIRL